MDIVLLFLYAGLTFLVLFFRKNLRQWKCNPSFWFVMAQLIFFIGTVYTYRTRNLALFGVTLQSHLIHLSCMLIGMAFFFMGDAAASAVFKVDAGEVGLFAKGKRYFIEKSPRLNVAIYGIVAFSLFIGLVYYKLVGYNLFWESIQSLLGRGELADATSLRLAAYSGERYFAPGYVNQFKNVLLPMFTIFILARYIFLKKKRDLIATAFILPLALILILGTGQRGPFVISVLIATVFFATVLPKRKVKKIFVFTILPIMIVGYFTLTIVLGRTETDTPLVKVAAEPIERILVGNQLSGIVGFDYVYKHPVSFKNGWLKEISSVLPGRRESKLTSLASEVFGIFYGGSTRGTAPISLWGSIYNSFSFAGILLIPFALGIFYHYVYFRFMRGPKSLLRILFYSQIAILAGLWISGSILEFFNSGLITIILLMLIFKAMRLGRRTAVASRFRNLKPVDQGRAQS